jgi:FtsP/CotA-like multicopper oxidase with cupredoxin domain
MAVRNVFLRIEQIDKYSPVAPMAKVAPPIQYRRDCLYGTGHGNGLIPDAEVLGRSLTGLVYREYHDPDFLLPVVDKLVDADINEPIWSRRVPGAVIYAQPGDTLKITVFNADSAAHSLHVHGLEYGIDSDGSWPFGTQSSDGRRSDEICPGTSWTYTFRVTEESVGAWPFHDHSVHPTHAIDRGLFGGIIVLPRGRPRAPVIELPDHVRERLEALRDRLRKRRGPIPLGPPGPDPHGPHRPLDPDNLVPGAVHPRLDPAERARPGHDVVRPRHPRQATERPPEPDEVGLLLRQQRDLLDEFVLHQLVRPKKPPAEPPTLHVPLFFHVLKDEHAVPAFDSGDIEELTGVYELTFNDAGDFEYFCRYHPFMVGTVQVVAGGPATATVHIVDAPQMGFSPTTTTIGVGGTVRWENQSQQHHTVTSRQDAAMATHCFNGRGFVGNSPTILARSGQRIRWYVFNLDIGETWHNFHPHSMRWQFAGETIDVRSLGPAESFVVETVAPPVLLLTEEMERIQKQQHRPKDAKQYDLVGDFLFHCHVHHHMMNGMVGLVRSQQTVWLTDEMVAELQATQGLPLDQGTNACPPVTFDRCAGAGHWETVTGNPEVTFMHSMLVPTTDKVLYWGYTRPDQTRLWDYSTPAGTYSTPANQPADLIAGPDPANESDLWSAEHEYLDTATGAILAHGGFSPNKAFVFDAAGLSWSRVADTAEDRFYSTTLSLEDGRIITLFGSDSKSFEIYQHGAGWSPPIAVPPEFNIYQYYPWTYLLPDGRLVIAGHQNPARRFDPTAPVADPAETFATLHGTDRSSVAENGTSVLLPLRPPDYRPRVVIAGGNNPTLLNSVEIIDLGAAVPAWQPLPDLHHARGNLSAVLLPTGQVFVAGGLDGGPDGGPAEILDAESPTPAWQLGPTMTFHRGYHSSFLLLADGSVLGGGDPDREPDGSPTPHERFYPAYFDLPRPQITNAPGQLGYGQSFTVDTPQGNDIVEVILLRPGAITHGFNMTQRAVECLITGTTAGSVDAEAPPDPRIAPPGWYLLFVLSGLRAPSTGRWIRLTP